MVIAGNTTHRPPWKQSDPPRGDSLEAGRKPNRGGNPGCDKRFMIIVAPPPRQHNRGGLDGPNGCRCTDSARMARPSRSRLASILAENPLVLGS